MWGSASPASDKRSENSLSGYRGSPAINPPITLCRATGPGDKHYKKIVLLLLLLLLVNRLQRPLRGQ